MTTFLLFAIFVCCLIHEKVAAEIENASSCQSAVELPFSGANGVTDDVNDDELLLPTELRDEAELVLPPNCILQSAPSSPVHWKDFDIDAFLEKGQLKPDENPYETYQINRTIGDTILYYRQLPDPREKLCRNLTWDTSKLPVTSIILGYHNEDRASLLRTLLSIFYRTPPELIAEIIIIDDFSDDESIGKELAVIEKVTVLRNTKRYGLMHCRVRGASIARAPVVTFFDGHVEVINDWLQPLLARIKENNKAVVSPVVDSVDSDTFRYKAPKQPLKGAFMWDLNFEWSPLEGNALEEHMANPIAPIRTPAINGGQFAVSRLWFEKTGGSDPGIETWAHEHIELGIRMWLCGGSMEIIPCSHVGHLNRKKFPYTFPDGAETEIRRHNRRVAEVWLGEHKHRYYRQHTTAKEIEYGDISERLELKHKLGCKEFDWFLENVYPELPVPVARQGEHLEFRHGNHCLDSLWQHEPGTVQGIYPCTATGNNQEWVFDKHTGQLMNTATYHCTIIDKDSGSLVVRRCDEVTTHWNIDMTNGGGIIRQGNVCLAVVEGEPFDNLELRSMKCDENDIRQLWSITVVNFVQKI